MNILKTNCKFHFLALLFFLLIPLCSTAWAANYHVDGSCVSSGNGTTATCGASGPWKTLAEAASRVPNNAEHTINVASGTYAERVTDTRNGASSGHYRWWKANGAVYMRGFYIDGTSYLKITGFDIEAPAVATDSGGTGIYAGTATYSVFDSNVIHDCVSSGIFMWMANYNTVSNNTIYRCGYSGLDLNTSNSLIENNDISDIRNYIKGLTMNDGQADGIHPFGANNTIRGNYIHDITYAHQTCNGSMGGCDSTHEPPHIDAFQTWDAGAGVLNNSIFEKNHVVLMDGAIHNNTAMHGFMFNGGAHDLTFRNNIFEVHNFMNTNNTSGVKLYNLYFYNNTFRSSLAFASDPYGMYCFSFEQVTGTVEIINNITVDFGSVRNHHYGKISPCNATIVQKNNCIFNSDGSTPGMVAMTNDATDKWKIDPKFVNQWEDLHLQDSSPLIDGGVDLSLKGVTTDYVGLSRPQGAGFDIGAYEYNTSSAPLSPPQGLRIIN